MCKGLPAIQPLPLHEPRKAAVLCYKLIELTFLNDISSIKHKDSVTVLDG